jgi:hypothetical protein
MFFDSQEVEKGYVGKAIILNIALSSSTKSHYCAANKCKK